MSSLPRAEDKAFLDFFFTRLRRNAPEEDDEDGKQYRERGYRWVSPCGPELNYVRSSSSPIVYQDLSPEGDAFFLRGAPPTIDFSARSPGSLLYAGTLTTPFDPTSLRADPHTGYLYHPSPRPPRDRDPAERYGAYSLLRSSLVLTRLREGMDVDEDGSGRFVWQGERRTFSLLEAKDLE